MHHVEKKVLHSDYIQDNKNEEIYGENLSRWKQMIAH